MNGLTLTRLLVSAGWTCSALFLVIGAWDLLIAGAYKLIVLGAFTVMVTRLLVLTLRRDHERDGA